MTDNILRPTFKPQPRPLHFWHVAGDVIMRVEGERPQPVPEGELAELRRHLRIHARAARRNGDAEANKLWTAKWRDLGDAMAALEHWKLVTGRSLREQLQASVASCPEVTAPEPPGAA